MPAISNLIAVLRRMKTLLWICLGLLLFELAHAGEPGPVFTEGLLFKVEKPQQPVTYVLGTIHSGDPRVTTLSDSIQSSLQDADQYIMEVVIDGSSIFSSLGNLWLLDGQKLSQVIGQELYEEVIETGKLSGMPEATFTYMKPWVVMMMFSLPPGNYENILDIHLMKLALKQNKKVLGLETVQEQFAVFDDMPINEQIRLLDVTLKNYPDLAKQYTELFDAYLQKDLEKLQQLSREQVESQDLALLNRLMERLLDARNQRMVSRLLPLLHDGKSFVAVGALHLPGESGILNLLHQQGFTVTRIE